MPPSARLFHLDPLEPRRLLSTAGQPDPTFGDAGTVKFDLQDDSHAYNLLIRPDGKILLTGQYQAYVHDHYGPVLSFALALLNSDGSLDTSFHDSGIHRFKYYPADYPAGISSIAIAPDGSLVLGAAAIGGYSALFTEQTQKEFYFGQDFHTVDQLYYVGSPQVAVQSDGKIIVAGNVPRIHHKRNHRNDITHSNMIVARFTPDLQLDTSFSANGWIETNFADAIRKEFSREGISDVFVQPDGKIVVGGLASQANNRTRTDYFVIAARYNRNGTLDRSFGHKGKIAVRVARNVNSGSFGARMVRQDDGRLILAGGPAQYSPIPSYLVRLDADGSQDLTYGNHGFVSVPGFTDVELQPDGKLLLGSKSAITRYNIDGSLDSSFGQSGEIQIESTTGQFAVQPDGKIITADEVFIPGSDGSYGHYGFAAHRYLNPGVTPTQSPYHFTPFSTNQRIQAEDFDTGGQGVSFHDTDPSNQGGLYCSSPVDIGLSADTDHGYALGWTRPGEWLEYTLAIPTAGRYDLDLRFASQGPGGSLHFDLDNQPLTRAISLPNTGSWQNWQTLTLSNLSLPAGRHTLRLAFDTPNPAGSLANLNWFRFRPSTP